MKTTRAMKTTVTVPINIEVRWRKESNDYIATSKMFRLVETGASMEKAGYKLRIAIQSYLGEAYINNGVLSYIFP